ncbi:MAG TPA: R3H domain-containing nucleic acid-binding protein [Anaerolineae bacterium]|nr:R3H domain-containing nucleic acid-binding protein [Anaerolineae bacterium]
MSTQLSEDLRKLLGLLPANLQTAILQEQDPNTLLEVVMDLGRYPSARYVSGEHVLRQSEVTAAELAHIVTNIGDFDDDNRAGIARTLHRISAIRNRRGDVVGLTCRVGRAVHGTIDILADLIDEQKSILILGRPGVGKTTMLREIARILAQNRRVIIVDTSNEIGGDGDIPHPAIGQARRMQVPRPSHQHETMIEAVENHNPEVIIIDEIGREQEAVAARTINERGVQLIGTAHGNSLENLLLNPTLSDLIGGIESVTLSDEEARRRGTQKTVLERRAPPTFDVLVEMQERQRVIVHRDVSAGVDALLRGEMQTVELRYRDDAGQTQTEPQEIRSENPAITGRREMSSMRVSQRPRPVSGHKLSNGTTAANGPAVALSQANQVTTDANETVELKQFRVYAYGVARNRLLQAAKRLGVRVILADRLDEADALVTLKSYYRRRPRVIDEAQSERIPIYVLRANTAGQIQNFIAEALQLEVSSPDPFESAVAEAEEAIQTIYAGQTSVDLSPAGSAMRRYQHQLARQANLVSHSYGKEPHRHVRIYGTNRAADA